VKRLAAALVGASLALACDRPPAVEPPPSASAAPSAAIDVALVRPRLDLGATVAGGYVKGELELRAGPRGATVMQISPSCGCTLVEAVTPARLEAGQVLKVPVALDLSRLADQGAATDGPRLIERTIAIVSDQGTRMTATLAVTVSERLRIVPPQARFLTAIPGRTGRVEVAVTTPAGGSGPAILEVIADRPDLAWVPGVDPSTGTLTWTPAAAGPLDALVELRLEGEAQPLALRCLGQAESPVSVEPDRVESLSARLDRPVVAMITLNRRDSQPLEILGATCTAHRVTVRVAPAPPGPVRTVQVIVPVLPPPAEIQGTVVIRTNVEGAEAVEVPVRVRGAP
jgi:hypothetical protein